MKTLAGSVLLLVLATSPMVWVVPEAGNERTASVCPAHGSICCCPDTCLKQLKTPDNSQSACALPVRKPDQLRFVSDCGAEPESIGFMNLKAVFLPPVRTGFGDLGSGLSPEAPIRTPLIPPVPDDPPPRSFF